MLGEGNFLYYPGKSTVILSVLIRVAGGEQSQRRAYDHGFKGRQDVVTEGQRQRQKASQREIGRCSAAGPEGRGRGCDPRSTGKL